MAFLNSKRSEQFMDFYACCTFVGMIGLVAFSLFCGAIAIVIYAEGIDKFFAFAPIILFLFFLTPFFMWLSDAIKSYEELKK